MGTRQSASDIETVMDLRKGIYRRIYAGFISGKRICAISLEAEAWFWRINAVVDDFGNHPADGALLRNATAGKREISTQKLDAYVKEMTPSLVTIYFSDGDKFLHVNDFLANQPANKNGRRIRKYPPFPGDDGESGGIRGNPGESRESKASHSHSHSHSQNDSHSQPHSDAKPGGGGEFGERDRQVDYLHGIPQPQGVLAVPLVVASWNRYLDYLEEKEQKLSRTGLRSLLTRMEQWGPVRAVSALEFSMSNNWLMVKEPEEKGRSAGAALKQTQSRPTQRVTTVDM